MDPFTFAIITGIIATLGGAVIIGAAQYSPRLMRRVKRWFLGTNFVILGPRKAGKTSFLNYLKLNQLADVYPTNSTLKITETGSFTVDKGGDLSLEVSEGFDTPGDLSTKDQLDVAIRERPETLILWTSLTDPKAGEWLASTCLHLNNRLLEDPAMAKRLKSLTVVMNKQDEVSDNLVAERKKEFESIISKTLRPAFEDNVDKVAILPCTLVRDKGGEKAGNAVLLNIASSLIKAKPLTRRR